MVVTTLTFVLLELKHYYLFIINNTPHTTYVLPEHEPGPEEVEGGLGPDPLIRHVEHDLLQLVHGVAEHRHGQWRQCTVLDT